LDLVSVAMSPPHRRRARHSRLPRRGLPIQEQASYNTCCNLASSLDHPSLEERRHPHHTPLSNELNASGSRWR